MSIFAFYPDYNDRFNILSVSFLMLEDPELIFTAKDARIEMEGGMGDVGEASSFKVVVEEEVVVTVGDFVTAFMLLIGCHYVFNLVYPEKLSCFYIFFQKFILKIMDNSKLPSRVSGLINKIKKLE